MEGCKIIDYTVEWKDRVKTFMNKNFPLYSDAYIEYSLSHSTGKIPSKLVINNNNEVVGSHFYYCTKVLIKGEEIETQWGHDTFLDSKYRQEIGTEFALMRKHIPAFGIGLTEVNKKLNKLMKRVFLKGVYNYYTITPYVVVSPFQSINRKKKRIVEDRDIVVEGNTYKRVYSSEEINIPNNGFWYKDFYDIDFIRDKEFLDNRFFKNSVHDYLVFASEDSYFVVRNSVYRGIPAIILSDFRYNPRIHNSAYSLLRAVRKLAGISRIGIVYFVCGDKRIEEFFHNKLHYKTPLDFISSYNKLSSESSYSLCGGDSDAEFLKA